MSDPASILDYIPATVWGMIGAVVAAFFISITNLISNVSNNKRLSLQLAHDANEKNIDRMNNLRREIYLEAVEQMTKASGYFGSIPYKEIGDQNIATELEGLYISAAKLSLVAPPETHEAVDSLGVEYWKLMNKVMNKLPPMQELKAEINLYSAMYDQSMTEVKRLIGVMNSLRESGRVDDDAMHGLKSSFDFLSDQAADYAEKRKIANYKFFQLCGEYSCELMADMRPVAMLQGMVVIAIRKDFGIETDEARMMAHLGQQLDAVSAAVANAFKD